jgi:uncharacterized protein
MLIQFRVANYRSIADEQELSFVAASLTDLSQNAVPVSKYGMALLRAVGIYGANASGKSSVLKALRFMQNAVLQSQRSWKPQGGIEREHFLLDTKKSSAPSSFEVDILVDDNRYTYGFAVDSVKVREEWLYAYPQGKKQKWFVRDVSKPKEYSFSRFLTGENRAIQSLTRPNSLFLSAAAQNNHRLLVPIFNWFSDKLNSIDEQNRENEAIAARKYATPEFQTGMLEIIKGADLGVTAIDIEESTMGDLTKKIAEVVFSDEPETFKKFMADPTLQRPALRHSVGTASNDMQFPFSVESHGTQILFTLAGFVVETLSKGGLLCVDELDASLHPLLSVEIVKMFNDPKKNVHDAQLLFNTHDTNVLEYGNLRRDQIWFTEKDTHGATHLYPLTDYKPRKDENVKRGYLQGRYGGVPFIRAPEELLRDGRNGST